MRNWNEYFVGDQQDEVSCGYWAACDAVDLMVHVAVKQQPPDTFQPESWSCMQTRWNELNRSSCMDCRGAKQCMCMHGMAIHEQTYP